MILPSILVLIAGLTIQDPQQRIDQLCARAPALAKSEQIGSSVGGQPIFAVTLAANQEAGLGSRQAILIVAGADADHRLGTDLALWQLEHLIDGYAEDTAIKALLDQHVIYVIAVLNPDGLALGRSGNGRSLDLDRDGDEDEDGADDLNEDGVISQMRWRDPEGEWLVDSEDPRLMRKADASKGERGEFMLAIEAKDADGDEERGEDDGQGVQIDRNFSHRFDEFDRASGPFPMSEPESRALAEFVFGHRHIALAFVYGEDNNLLGKVATDEPKPRMQLEAYLEKDVEMFEQAGEIYAELTGREGDGSPRHDGSLWSWLYFQTGTTTFANDVWRVPTASGKDEDQMSAEAARLQHCDTVDKGFLAWSEFDHPQLGKIEVGGFVQDRDWELMPMDIRDTSFGKQHEFFMTMIDRLPKTHIASFTKKLLPGGAFEIEAVVENSGRWPTLSAQAQRTRRFSLPRLTLHLGGADLLAGEERPRSENLQGLGGRETFKWIVSGSAGLNIRLELDVDPAGSSSKEVTL